MLTPIWDLLGWSEHDFNALAQYNAECARGLEHTPAWKAKMAELQREYDNKIGDFA